MTDTIQEPARNIPVAADVDVLVAGGGPAGIAAALSAARAGARTMIVERYGYLGGMITGAYVVAIIGVGDGHVPVVRGITAEMRERMEPLGAVRPRNDPGDYVVDAEMFKWQAVEMLQEAGVRIRLHTWACAPILDGRARGRRLCREQERARGLSRQGDDRRHRRRRPGRPGRLRLRQRDARHHAGPGDRGRGPGQGGRRSAASRRPSTRPSSSRPWR